MQRGEPVKTIPTANTTHTASSYCPISALTTLLPNSNSMSGLSYTCFANLMYNDSVGGSSNSFEPY